MLSNLMWPGMIGVALAVGLGVQMGRSAIGDINPVHFQGAAARPQGIPAALPPPPRPAYPQAYSWEEGNAAREADSAGHDDFQYVPQAIVRPAAEPVWREAAAPVNLAPWAPGRVSAHPQVERYTDYPIEEKVVDQLEVEPPLTGRPEPRPDASPLATGKAQPGQ